MAQNTAAHDGPSNAATISSPPPAAGFTNFQVEDQMKERMQEKHRKFPSRVAWNEYCKNVTGFTYNGTESAEAFQSREGMTDKIPQELLFPVIGGLSEIEKKSLMQSYDKMT